MVSRLDDWLKVQAEKDSITTDPGTSNGLAWPLSRRRARSFGSPDTASGCFRQPQHWSEFIVDDLVISAAHAEIIHGAPTRFDDPARVSFAHGGKDGHPFSVPLKSYDETLAILRRSLAAARIGNPEKVDGFRGLDRLTRAVEHGYEPVANFERTLAHEDAISPAIGGRTVFDDPRRRKEPRTAAQLSLFDRFPGPATLPPKGPSF